MSPRRRRSNTCLQVGHASDRHRFHVAMAWHGMAAAKGLIDADGLQAQLRCLDGTCRELAWRSKTLRILRISTDWIPTTEGTDAIQDRFRTNWWQEFLSRIFSHMSLIRSVGTRGKCEQLCIGVTDPCGADLLRFCLDKWTGDGTSYAAMQWIHLKNSQFGT